MGRGDRWWNEPPLWAWIVMAVAATSLAVLLPFALDRQAPGGASAGPGSAPTPDASSTPAATGSTAAPSGESPATGDAGARVVVVGDGYTSGTAQGGRGAQGWPALVEERIEGTRVEVAADVRAGYVTTGESGQTFGELADAVGLEDAAVVVISGSRDDGPGVADQVAVAARDLFERTGEVAPEAELVVVGPIWPEEVAPAGARNNRDVIRERAEAVGARFVDPLEEGWLVDEPGLLGDDGVYPTDEGHAHLADLLEPVVRDALTG